MKVRLLALVGAGVGLIVAGTILVLLWLGVSGVLEVGQTDLMYVLWPSSVVLVGGWRTTALGILITICSVVANCLMYAAVALLLRWVVGLVGMLLPTR